MRRGGRLATAAGGRAVPGQPHHRRPLGEPVPADGRRGHARPLQPPAPPAVAHTGRHRADGGASAARAPYRAGPAGRPNGSRRLHRPPGPQAPRHAPTGRLRPGHRRARATLRTRPARRTGPHRRQETRPHPRRRRPQSPRPGSRQPEQGPPQRRRIRLPAHRPGRPHPPCLHRRPPRRDRTHLRRLPPPQTPNARQRFPTGWTGATTTDPTPASTATHPPAASPTCPDNTPSRSTPSPCRSQAPADKDRTSPSSARSPNSCVSTAHLRSTHVPCVPTSGGGSGAISRSKKSAKHSPRS